MANRFWVGGTGTWDATNNGHWSLLSGSTGNQAAPVVGDVVTFDGASGGGTVTVNTTVSCASITCGAFTGTLDFSAHNNDVTLSATGGFNGSGAGTRTINLGNGTWTLTGIAASWTMTTTTGLTFNANSSTITFTATTASTRTFNSGSLSYSTLSISANASGGAINLASPCTIANLSITGPNCVQAVAGGTITVTNAMSISGSAGSEIAFQTGTLASQTTYSSANNGAFSWCAFREIAFVGGGTFTATNSFDLGHNSGVTITAPNSNPRTIYGA